jgi:mono/diheme cytochrome c family protein
VSRSIVVVALLTFAGAARAADAPGRAVFGAQHCDECHAVSSQGITSKGDAPDLAGVGNRHPADWLKRFLTKQEELNGHKHKKKFAGTDAELDQLAQWLSSLK